MRNQEVFKSKSGMDLTPAAGLYLLAEIVYGDRSSSTDEDRDRAGMLLDEILSAAYAGGYPQCDILHTLLARNELTQRLLVMAVMACDAAGGPAIARAISRAQLL